MDGQMFFKTLLSGKSATAPPIQFSGGDDTNCFPVRGSEVEVVSSLGDHDVGSSKLKIKNIVNFGWEHKFYPGRIVAAHRSDTYLAYTITTPGKLSSDFALLSVYHLEHLCKVQMFRNVIV